MNYNVLLTYFIGINVLSYIAIGIFAKTDLFKGKDKIIDTISMILSALGGFVGTLVGAEMFNYKKEDKTFKKWIPLIIFLEICIVILIFWQKNK